MTTESTFFYKMVSGNYEDQGTDYGYLKCDSNANHGRIISLIELPLSPIRYAVDFAISAVLSLAHLVVCVVSSLIYVTFTVGAVLTTFASDSSIHKFFAEKRVTFFHEAGIALNLLSVGSLLMINRFYRAPVEVIGNLVGLALPEYGHSVRGFSPIDNQEFVFITIGRCFQAYSAKASFSSSPF